MNEEAAFIAALLAEPGDRTTLLVYADWLDERDDSRAAYLRLLAAERPNQRRLAALRRTFDAIWTLAVADRIGCGVRVRIRAGAFDNTIGTVIGLRTEDAGAAFVTLRMTFWDRPLDVELESPQLEREGD